MKRHFSIIITLAASFSLLAGCGQVSKESSPNTSAPKSNAGPSVQSVSSPTTAAQTSKPENVYVVIEPGVKKASDGKLHDSFIGGDLSLTVGKPVTLNFYNYDEGAHTYTSADLGLNVQIAGSKKKGEPAVTTFTFTPAKEGAFDWMCAVPCDGDNGQWAMSQDGYMKGKITVTPVKDHVQHITMVANADYKLGSDGKMHDAYTPGDVTVNAGTPVQLTVYHFGKNPHPIISSDLGLNLQVTNRKDVGDPGVFQTTFTPDKTGKFQWMCGAPCDGANQGWAMMNDNYMMGYFTVQ